MSRIENALIDEARYQAKCLARTDEPAARFRLNSYEPKAGHSYTCPICYVTKEQFGILRSVPSSSGDDVMVCNECERDVVIPG